MITFLQRLLSTWQGGRTYLASAVLAGLGTLLLATGGEGTFATALLAQGGGLAALRHAIGRVQSYLATLEQRLESVARTMD